MRKYSIIIPVYNRPDSIATCIESAINQAYPNCEIIIINDGSTDETNEILKGYQDKLIIISYQKNMGVNYARNQGILKATGNFIVFLDSDDYFSDNAVSEINETIENNPNFKHYLFSVSGKERSHENTTCLYSYKDWIAEDVSGDFVHVIKPECFESKMFFESFNAFEILNWMRVFKSSSPQLFINKIICQVDRGRSDSLTSQLTLRSPMAIKEQCRFLKKYLEMYGSDLKQYNSVLYIKKIKKAILLAVSIGDYEYAHSLQTEISGYDFYFYKAVSSIKSKTLIYNLIKLKSHIGNYFN